MKTTTTTADRRVSLTTQLFHEALRRYIEESKPDPLAKRQLEGWVLEWKNGDGTANPTPTPTPHDDEKAGIDKRDEKNSTIGRFVLEGTLEIIAEYVAVVFKMECSWTVGNTGDDRDGELFYSCHVVSARILTKPRDGGSLDDGADQTTRTKIREKVTTRLRQDSYITKLLQLQDRPDDDVRPNEEGVIAKATIRVDATQHILEERVDVTDDVAEAVRRALWPASESSLDMVEVILALPSLPCKGAGSSSDPTTAASSPTTPLANRAKLRLLEDAMLDACEREGEDQLIEDLKITPEERHQPGMKTKEQDDEGRPGSKKKKSKSR